MAGGGHCAFTCTGTQDRKARAQGHGATCWEEWRVSDGFGSSGLSHLDFELAI